MGEGVITRIEGQVAHVLLREGLEIPVPLTSLVAVARREEEKQLEKGSPVRKPAGDVRPGRMLFLTEGLFLAGTRQPAPAAYLINQSHMYFKGVVYRTGRPLNHFHLTFEVEPRSWLTFPTGSGWNETSHQTGFHFQWIAWHPDSGNPMAPGEKRVAFRDLPGPGAEITLPQIEKSGFLFQLDGAAPDPAVAGKIRESMLEGPRTPLPGLKAVRIEYRETDLHIEALSRESASLPAGRILEIQLEAFEKAVDSSLIDGAGRLILIHGAGNGVLRAEIRKRLQAHPLVKSFGDAPRQKYGGGATEAIF